MTKEQLKMAGITFLVVSAAILATTQLQNNVPALRAKA